MVQKNIKFLLDYVIFINNMNKITSIFNIIRYVYENSS